MPARERLTEKLVKGLSPRHDDYHVFDEEVRGLAVVVYTSGSRAFNLSYRAQGRQRRITIGRWPEWSVVAARERAKFLRREIDAGADPLGKREEARAAPRVEDLVDRYIKRHIPKLAPSNGRPQEATLRKLVLPLWGKRLVEEITADDVDDLLTMVAEGSEKSAAAAAVCRRGVSIGKRPAPIRANRIGAMLSKMFALAIDWRMRADNPAAKFHKRIEAARERFLTPEEILRVAEVLDAAEDQRAASIIRICLLSGARVGEVRMARFEQFNLELLLWTKPPSNTKQRRVHRVPISPEVAAVVRQRRAAVPPGCPWLFPGDAEGKPVQEMRRFWRRVQAEAGVDGVRIHDLRHTFASLLVSGGASLLIVGKLLGHSQAQTTERYAHLMDSPLRAGVNAVAGILTPRPRLVHSADGE